MQLPFAVGTFFLDAVVGDGAFVMALGTLLEKYAVDRAVFQTVADGSPLVFKVCCILAQGGGSLQKY